MRRRYPHILFSGLLLVAGTVVLSAGSSGYHVTKKGGAGRRRRMGLLDGRQ
jgi:hypothetical protein